MIGHEVNQEWTADLKHRKHNSVQEAAEAGEQTRKVEAGKEQGQSGGLGRRKEEGRLGK